MRRHIIGGLIGAGIAALVALPALAAVPPHRHYILDAAGQKVYVGPNFCELDATSKGFEQFHTQVHRGLPDASKVTVLSEGC